MRSVMSRVMVVAVIAAAPGTAWAQSAKAGRLPAGLTAETQQRLVDSLPQRGREFHPMALLLDA